MNEQISSIRYACVNARKSNGMPCGCGRESIGSAPRSRSGSSRGRPVETEATPLLRAHHTMQAPNDLKSEFLPVLAHELRNSLCVIRMAAGILDMEVSAGPAVIKARTLIEHQTAHMSRLVEDLLDSSRAPDIRMPLKCNRVDLCAVATQAVRAVEFTMQRRQHRLTTLFPAGPLWLEADPARLEQVFVNLLFNAAKYTDSGGRIQLSVERDQGEAVVRIRDSGIGIAPSLLPRVFDLFVQAEPSARRTDTGMGIGLALVRNLVDRHGGCVTAASAGLGQGSEFVIRLPMPG